MNALPDIARAGEYLLAAAAAAGAISWGAIALLCCWIHRRARRLGLLGGDPRGEFGPPGAATPAAKPAATGGAYQPVHQARDPSEPR